MAVNFSKEGKIAVQGGDVWYGVAGEGDACPLVAIHGGPGGGSPSTEPLADLSNDRPVVLYDQLGCGKSDRPADPSLWQVDRFVDELDRLLDALKYEKAILMGTSWGSMVAVDYILEHPTRVSALVLPSPCLNTRRFADDCAMLIRELGPEYETMLNDPTATDQDRKAIDTALFKNYFCRMDPLPEPILRSIKDIGREVFEVMWGPNDYTLTGNLVGYDRTDDLHKIKVPTLFTCGRFDQATPEATRHFASKVPGAQFMIFEESAHLAMFEERDTFVSTIRQFLQGL